MTSPHVGQKMPPPSVTAPAAPHDGQVVFGALERPLGDVGSLFLVAVVLVARGRDARDARARRPRGEPTTAVRTMRPVILDGHNDLALRVWLGQEPAHIDLATARRVRLRGRLLRAVGSSERPVRAFPSARCRTRCRSTSRSPREKARRDVEGQLARARGPRRRRSSARVERSVPGRVNAIVHFEGAEPIAPDLSDLERLVRRAGCARSGSSGRGRTRSAKACRSASRRRPTPAPG